MFIIKYLKNPKHIAVQFSLQTVTIENSHWRLEMEETSESNLLR